MALPGESRPLECRAQGGTFPSYYDGCEAIQRTRLDVGGLDESGQFELGELVCTVCATIIAPLFRPVKGFGSP